MGKVKQFVISVVLALFATGIWFIMTETENPIMVFGSIAAGGFLMIFMSGIFSDSDGFDVPLWMLILLFGLAGMGCAYVADKWAHFNVPV
jgi:hypothetical protein